MQDFLEFNPISSHVFVDLDCPESLKVLQALSERRFFNASRRFVLFNEPGTLNASLNLLGQQDINVNSEMLLVIREGDLETEDVLKVNEVEYKIYQISSPGTRNGGRLRAVKVGNVSSKGHLSLRRHKPNYDFEGTVASVAINVRIAHSFHHFIFIDHLALNCCRCNIGYSLSQCSPWLL